MTRTADNEWKWRRREAIIRDNYTCQECGEKGGPKGDAQLHAHHKTPVADGGTDELENLETLCRSCHFQHHAELLSGPPGEAVGVGSEGKSFDELGRFTRQHTDADVLEAVRKHEPAGTQEIADELGIVRQSADYRLRKLLEEGRVSKKKVGHSLVWMLDE